MWWMFLRRHLPSLGSPSWKRIGEAWRNINEHVLILPPTYCYQVLQSNLWWNIETQRIGFGFNKVRATQLSRKGLCIIKNLLDVGKNQPLHWDVIKTKYKLDEREKGYTNILIATILEQWWWFDSSYS